jgi:hypothetical protein
VLHGVYRALHQVSMPDLTSFLRCFIEE